MDESPVFSGNAVQVDGHSWSTRFPIHDARRISGRIIVIYEYRSSPQSVFNNLEAFSPAGVKLWTAENPGDVYVDFMSEQPLVASQFACLRVTIDADNGKVLQSVFTK